MHTDFQRPHEMVPIHVCCLLQATDDPSVSHAYYTPPMQRGTCPPQLVRGKQQPIRAWGTWQHHTPLTAPYSSPPHGNTGHVHSWSRQTHTRHTEARIPRHSAAPIRSSMQQGGRASTMPALPAGPQQLLAECAADSASTTHCALCNWCEPCQGCLVFSHKRSVPSREGHSTPLHKPWTDDAHAPPGPGNCQAGQAFAHSRSTWATPPCLVSTASPVPPLTQ